MQRKFRTRILRTAEMHVRWWDLLQESSPDLLTFLSLGTSLLAATREIKHMWRELRRSSAIHSSVLSVYARFCGRIQDDKRKAARLVHKYGEEGSRRLDETALAATGQTGSDEGVIAVSARKETLGQIITCNKAFSQIAGYIQPELTGRPVTSLMPSIYRDMHAAVMEKCCAKIERGESDQQKAQSTKYCLQILHKAGYIVPVTMRLVDAPHFINGHSFVASVTRTKEATGYGQAYLILDTERRIVAFTSSIFDTHDCRLHYILRPATVPRPVSTHIRAHRERRVHPPRREEAGTGGAVCQGRDAKVRLQRGENYDKRQEFPRVRDQAEDDGGGGGDGYTESFPRGRKAPDAELQVHVLCETQQVCGRGRRAGKGGGRGKTAAHERDRAVQREGLQAGLGIAASDDREGDIGAGHAESSFLARVLPAGALLHGLAWTRPNLHRYVERRIAAREIE